jgi:SAM-dependent methyltransferase
VGRVLCEPPSSGSLARPTLILYAAAIFFSAALLFSVQPLFARMALPFLGGSPSVWNAALVFYQATLLAGYVYAHVSTRLLTGRTQALLHALLVLLPLIVLPIRIAPDWAPPSDVNPTLSFLALLTGAVGLPFFALSTTAPVLQRWFTKSGHPSAADPYFLYAASNAGSFLALLSYPLVIDRLLPLSIQARWWAIGYAVFVVLMGASVLTLLGRANAAVVQPSTAGASDLAAHPFARRARWLIFALIPSSLMLGVTTHISTDLAAMPMLWVLPLSIYLLSFVLVFARRPLPHRFFVRALPITAFAVVFTLAVKAIEPIAFVIPLHLVFLFVASMVCHGELARDRPASAVLTEFYLWMAVGGVLGGAFNALVAPLLFASIVEYPLMIVAVLLVAPLGGQGKPLQRQRVFIMPSARDVILPIAVAALTLLLVTSVERTAFTPRAQYVIAFGLPALVAFGSSRQPVRFGLAMGAILAMSTIFGSSRGHTIHSARTFFGVHRVAIDPSGSYHQLLHGGTVHGLQSVDPARRREPLGYYSASGPAGQILDSLARRPARIGVVGLGNGTLAAYALRGESWTFFEIDAAVERIARDSRWFTYLVDSPGVVRVVLGDGRLSLAVAGDRYDVLILDAYSSETIPLHLLSREALRVYNARLAPGGLLVFHISNRYFDLAPVIAGLAQDAGLEWRVRKEELSDPDEIRRGSIPSTWAVLTSDAVTLGALAADRRWRRVPPNASVWTDDQSSVLSALR